MGETRKSGDCCHPDEIHPREVAKLALKLKGIRDTVRRFLGDRYRSVIGPLVENLRSGEREPILVGFEAASRAVERGQDVVALQLMAAAFETLEPEAES